MKTQTEWAIRNLELAGYLDPKSDYNGDLGKAVIRLLEQHQKEGHSGSSHMMAIYLFKQVALDEALTMDYWTEKFNAYNAFALAEGHHPWTEESFENLVMKKPKV